MYIGTSFAAFATRLVLAACLAVTASAQGAWDRIGPTGADMHCMAHSPNHLYAGGREGVVVRSGDGGRNWEDISLTTEGGSLDVTSLVWHEAHHTLFAQASGRCFRYVAGAWQPLPVPQGGSGPIASLGEYVFVATFRSADNGDTWTIVDEGLTFPRPEALCTVGSVLLAGSSLSGTNVARSTDDGASWQTPPDCPVYAVSDMFVAGTTAYAIAADGVWSSADSGLTWKSLEVQPSRRVDRIVLSGTTLYARTNEHPRGLLVLADDMWTSIPGPDEIGELHVYANAVYIATPSGIYSTTDQGSTWTTCNAGIYAATVNALAGDGATLYAATNSMVYRSTDAGATWSDGLLTTYNAFSGLHAGAGVVVALTGDDMHISTDRGTTWYTRGKWLDEETMAVSVTSHKGMLVAGCMGGRIARSTDDGRTWERADVTGFPDLYGDIGAIASDGEHLYASLHIGYLHSIDDGASWTAYERAGNITDETRWFHHTGTRMVSSTRSTVHVYSADGSSRQEVVPILAAQPDVTAFGGRGNELFAVRGTGGVSQFSLDGTSLEGMENLGLQGHSIGCLAVMDGRLYAASKGNSLYRMTLQATSVRDLPGAQAPPPSAYPQPADDAVTIRGYDATGDVTLYGMDGTRAVVHGQAVANGTRLDVAGLAAGVWMLPCVGTDGTVTTVRILVH